MKKSVRIRKANPGETPGYVNKTKKFLQKAQMGMSVSNTNYDARLYENMINYAYTQLDLETDVEDIFYMLINDYKVDATIANAILKEALDRFGDWGNLNSDIVNEQSEQQEAPEAPEEVPYGQEEMDMVMQDDDDDYSHIENYAMYDPESSEEGEYYQFGGAYEEAPQEVMDQYNTVGNTNDLIQYQAGVPLVEPMYYGMNYSNPYSPFISNEWESQKWLGKKGGSVPKLPKAQPGAVVGKLGEGVKTVTSGSPLIYRGFDWYNRLNPVRSTGLSSYLPISTLVGKGFEYLPKWLGGGYNLESESILGQNVLELGKLLNSKEIPKTMSQFSRSSLNTDEFTVNTLRAAEEDLDKIVSKALGEGTPSFTLNDINPVAKITGGLDIYPLNSKVSVSKDAEGNHFIDISHTFKPGDATEFGVIPSNAASRSFRNRFYFNIDPATKSISYFDGGGQPMYTGSFPITKISDPLTGGRAVIPQLYSMVSAPYRKPGNVLGTSGILGRLKTEPGIATEEGILTATPAMRHSDLSGRQKVGRFIGDLTLGSPAWAATWPTYLGSKIYSHAMNKSDLFRTRDAFMENIDVPAIGYSSQQKINPLQKGINYADDISDLRDFYRRKGNRRIAALLGLGALGYSGYNYFTSPDENLIGNIRTLQDPTFNPNYIKDIDKYVDGIPVNDTLSRVMNDSMFGNFPTQYNYYGGLSREGAYDPDVLEGDPEYIKKEGGKISKKKFAKQVLSFFDEGGENSKDPSIGRGKRMDTSTGTLEKKIQDFKGNLSESSNMAAATEIENIASSLNDPTIYNILSKGKEGMPSNQNNNQMVQVGGFIDMNAENPLTKFISGGMETDYYEPYGLDMAATGMVMSGSKDPCPPGFYWSDLYNQCLEFDKGVPSQEDIINPLYQEYMDKLNYKRNVIEYKDQYEKNLNELMENYGVPYDQNYIDNPEEFIKHFNIDSPEYENFFNSQEYLDFENQYTNPKKRDWEGLPSNFEMQEYYNYGDNWDEKSKEIYNEFFSPLENNPEELDFFRFQEWRDKNPDKKWEDWENTPDFDPGKLREFNPIEGLDKKYENWCPCTKQIERIAGVIEEICVPCEQAKFGKFIPKAQAEGGPIFGSRYGDQDWDEYWTEHDNKEPGNWVPGYDRSNKEARQLARTINKKIRQGYVNPQGVDYSQFSKVKPKQFIVKSEVPTFQTGGELPKAQKGKSVQISDKAGNTKMVTEEEAQMWYEALEDNPDLSFVDLGFASDSPGSQQNQNSSIRLDTNQCSPGYTWVAAFNRCIETSQLMTIYPNIIKGPSMDSVWGNLTPWNNIRRGMGYVVPKNKRQPYPYSLITGNPYMGTLGNPDAQIVTKTGLFGRPKNYINLWNTGGNGFDASTLEALQNMYGPKMRGRNKERGNKERGSGRQMRDRGPSKTELIDQELMKDASIKDYWDQASRAEKRHARRDFAFDNPEFRRFSDKVIFGAGQPGQGRYYERGKKIKDKKYGGLPQAQMYNSIVNSNNQSNNPFSTNPFEADSWEKQASNYFMGDENAFTPSWQKQASQKMYNQGSTTQDDNDIIVQKNKVKNMWEVDPQAILNATNAGLTAIANIRPGQNKRERRHIKNTVATENNYGNTDQINRGWWGSTAGQTAGLFDIVDTGQIANSMNPEVTSKYGGYMEQGGTHKMFNGLNMRNSDHKYYEVDEEVYMTPEEIEMYLAAGGQIEYL